MRLLAILLALSAPVARAAPLTNAQTYGAAHPDAFRNGTPGMILVKGTTDNNSYMLEADPTTGAIPVSGTFSLGYDTNYGTVGANTLRSAAQIGNATGAAAFGAGTTGAQVLRVVLPTDQSAVPASQSGTWNITNVSGTVSLPTGAATVAKQPALGTAGTPSADVITVQGVTSMTALKVDGSATTQPVSGTVSAAQSGTWTVQPGNTANTTAWLTTQNGRSYGDSIRNVYSSTNVTTSAWVQLIAATAATINWITIFDSCGQTLELGTGAAASEARVLIIPPGGVTSVPLRIASGTRVSIRAISATCSTGELDLTGLN